MAASTMHHPTTLDVGGVGWYCSDHSVVRQYTSSPPYIQGGWDDDVSVSPGHIQVDEMSRTTEWSEPHLFTPGYVPGEDAPHWV